MAATNKEAGQSQGSGAGGRCRGPGAGGRGFPLATCTISTTSSYFERKQEEKRHKGHPSLLHKPDNLNF